MKCLRRSDLPNTRTGLSTGHPIHQVHCQVESDKARTQMSSLHRFSNVSLSQSRAIYTHLCARHGLTSCSAPPRPLPADAPQLLPRGDQPRRHCAAARARRGRVRHRYLLLLVDRDMYSCHQGPTSKHDFLSYAEARYRRRITGKACTTVGAYVGT